MNKINRARLLGRIAAATIGLFAMIAVFATSTSPASALCATPEESGSWQNINSDTRSMTRAEIELLTCGDVSLNGQPPPPTTYGISLWGSCSPSDCEWDQATATSTRTPDGARWLRATLDQGFVNRTIWTRTYEYSGTTYLRVAIWSDYRDSRTDKWSDEWMRKV